MENSSMLGLLFLFAAGVGAFVLSDDDSTEANSQAGDTASSGSSGDDASADTQGQGLSDESSILTARQLDMFDFIDGPIITDTGEGDDTVLGSLGNDEIITRSGDDYVIGDAGDDRINLGDGDDIAGLALRADGTVASNTAFTEPGDDTILGGPGNDQIADFQGSNTIEGNTGNDILNATDIEFAGVVTPDFVFGGFGSDTITVDEGDTVNTGPGNDTTIIDLFNFQGNGPAPAAVTITDFSLEKDDIVLSGPAALINTPPLTDPDDQFSTPVTELISPLRIEDTTDGSANVFLNDVLFLIVQGGAGLQLSDIELRN
jgi:Ca2+-binding RTX toxin-like protein